jgi:acyl-CoA thioesterase FadM
MTPYTYTFTVSPDVIDFNGQVGNVTYLEWMIEAVTRHSHLVGMSHESCLELGGIWVSKSHVTRYKLLTKLAFLLSRAKRNKKSFRNIKKYQSLKYP